MRTRNKLKRIFGSIILCLLFTTSTFANIDFDTNCNQKILKTTNYEPSRVNVNTYLDFEKKMIKDGKVRQAIKDFFDGLGGGLGDEPMPIIGGGNGYNGPNEEEIKKYAINIVKNKENVTRILNEIQKLIISGEEKINKNQILDILNPKNTEKTNPTWLQKELDYIFTENRLRPQNKVSKKEVNKLNEISGMPKSIKEGVIITKPNGGDILMGKINWKRIGWIVGKIIKVLL